MTATDIGMMLTVVDDVRDTLSDAVANGEIAEGDVLPIILTTLSVHLATMPPAVRAIAIEDIKKRLTSSIETTLEDSPDDDRSQARTH